MNSRQRSRRLATGTRAGFSRTWLRGEALEVRRLLTGNPVANNDSYNVDKNVELTVSAANGVLANDTDPNSLTLTATLNTAAAHGIVNLASNGSFTYEPTAGYVGTDSFTYTATDGTATSNVATVTLTVAAVPGTVANQSYTMFENQQLSIATPGLLTGSFDSNGPPLTAQLVNQASNGVATVNSNGSFTYQPNANFSGTDSFSFEGYDGIYDTNVATVTITVTQVTQAPTAANYQFHVEENGQLTIGTAPLQSVIALPESFNDLVYDAASGYLYGDTASSIVPINPATGALGTPVPVAGSPTQMVISTNGEYIYLVTANGGTIARFNTFEQAVDLTWSLASGVSVGTISAIPGMPNAVLISQHIPDSPGAFGTFVFQNGVALPDHVGNAEAGIGGPDESFVDPGGVNAYGFDTSDSSYGFVFMTISSNGVSQSTQTGHPLPGRRRHALGIQRRHLHRQRQRLQLDDGPTGGHLDGRPVLYAGHSQQQAVLGIEQQLHGDDLFVRLDLAAAHQLVFGAGVGQYRQCDAVWHQRHRIHRFERTNAAGHLGPDLRQSLSGCLGERFRPCQCTSYRRSPARRKTAR